MATNIDNMKSQMRKGMLEFCVLLLLSPVSYTHLTLPTKLEV